MIEIPLQMRRGLSGLVALVDDDDFDLVACFVWSPRRTNRNVYANATVGPYCQVDLHRYLLDFPEDEVDHVNGDGLDNRRANLRVVPHRLNLANQRPQIGKTSRFKGVSWDKDKRRWAAHIKVNQRSRTLGYFHDEVLAARSYDAAATAAWGEFARPNFPLQRAAT